jgi:hypothetical protein
MNKIKEPSDAHMCNSCSKFFCLQCVTTWLSTKRECPHCRTDLARHRLVACRWMQDVTASLAQLHVAAAVAPVDESGDRDRNNEMCPEHPTMPKDVYCRNCEINICSQCGCFSLIHKNHELRPFQSEYDENLKKIKKQISFVTTRKIELKQLIADLDANTDQINTAKENTIKDMRKFLESRVTNLEREKREKIGIIKNQKNKIKSEIDKIEKIINSTNEKIENYSKSRLIENKKTISDSLFNLTVTPMSGFLMPPVSANFSNQIEPISSSGEMIIENFSSIENSTQPIYSDPHYSNGLQWKLKVYPCGNESSRTTGSNSISIFLQLSDAIESHSMANYTYKISMAKRTGELYTREFSSIFEVFNISYWTPLMTLNILIGWRMLGI